MYNSTLAPGVTLSELHEHGDASLRFSADLLPPSMAYKDA